MCCGNSALILTSQNIMEFFKTNFNVASVEDSADPVAPTGKVKQVFNRLGITVLDHRLLQNGIVLEYAWYLMFDMNVNRKLLKETALYLMYK